MKLHVPTLLGGALATAFILSPLAASAKGDGYYRAQAGKEMKACIDLYDDGGVNEVISSVQTVSSCFAGGFITEVNFYSVPKCQPNQPCPQVVTAFIATVEFGCEDDIIGAQCYLNECVDNSDCSADSWCRQTEYGSQECVPYQQSGDSCGGFTLPWLYEQCDPSLTCVTDPFIADIPGVCATCNYNGTPYDAGDSFPADDGCNTCFCGDNGVIGCTKIACLQP